MELNAVTQGFEGVSSPRQQSILLFIICRLTNDSCHSRGQFQLFYSYIEMIKAFSFFQDRNKQTQVGFFQLIQFLFLGEDR